MRHRDEITVHCTASREGVDIGVDEIDEMHRKRGFKKQPKSGRYCGYHVVVRIDGTIEYGRSVDEDGAHCPPNSKRLGISYVGGLDKNGKPKDTRTEAQKASMKSVISAWLIAFPSINKIKGHRDNSPDTNKNGKVDKWEWLKSCPCFPAMEEYNYLLKFYNR